MVLIALKPDVKKSFKGASLQELKEAVEKEDFCEGAMEQMDQLNDQEVALNHRLCDLQKELGDLEIYLHRLEPEEIERRLTGALSQIDALEKPTTHFLQKQLSALKRRWKHLRFVQDFPVASELEGDSFQSNLVHRVSSEILRSPPKKARCLKRYLRLLQTRCKEAEKAFCKKGRTHQICVKMQSLAEQMLQSVL